MRRRMVMAAVALLGFQLTWTAAGAATQTKGGTPLSSVPIGLEGDPDSIVVATGLTNERHELDLIWRPARGEKGVRPFVADRAKLKAPVVMRITAGRQILVSAPILPGKGRGYANDARGKPLLVPSGAGQQTVKVTLTLAR